MLPSNTFDCALANIRMVNGSKLENLGAFCTANVRLRTDDMSGTLL